MKKHHQSKINQGHRHLQIFVLVVFILLSLIFIQANRVIDQENISQTIPLGVSFSPRYAQDLGQDPQVVYRQILKDLDVKNLRLSASWDEIEPKPGKFNFDNLDYYLSQAEAAQAQVLLAVGFKLPRWPECRSPYWLDYKNTQLRQERQLLMVKEVVKRYNQNPTVFAFQVENEPLLSFDFGICPTADEKFLQQEVALIRSLTKKPLILTDSGELGWWTKPMQLSDYMGTTLYRIVHNNYLGLVPYYFQPWYYRLKFGLISTLLAPQNKGTIVVELQGEPWANTALTEVSLNQQLQSFPLSQFKTNVNFAKKVGAKQIYLWGAEWWYYIKSQGHPEYWEYAKGIFKGINFFAYLYLSTAF